MLDRRKFIAACSTLGLTSTLLPGVLWPRAEEKGKIPRAMIDHAAAIADVPIADSYKEAMLETLNGYTQSYDAIYALKIPNSVAPAVIFDPVPPGKKLNTEKRPLKISAAPAGTGVPTNLEDVAFYSGRPRAS